MRLGQAKFGGNKFGGNVEQLREEAVWINPLISPGALGNFNGSASDSEFTIAANRSISNSALKKIFVAVLAICMVVAGFSYSQGNVWVPVFVVIDLSIVCFAVLAVARACTASDALIIDSSNKLLSVRSNRNRACSQCTFILAWVQLRTVGPNTAPRIYLIASGNSVEVGSFLNHEQRVSLASQLIRFLELAKARALN